MKLDLGGEEKEEYIQFMLRQYRLVDALWFLAVEDRFGLDAAVELNERVWEDMGRRSAKEIKRRFGVEEKGLRGFIKALKYFPWTAIIGYQIDERKDKVVISVPHCPPQEARIRMGREEFPCKEMHLREFRFFAEEIDERIAVKCVFAPPDERPEGWCRWEFTIE